MNVRFLDVLVSRGGYNYIIGGMMYSTGCWNYRLSQYRRYNKERKKKQREDGKVVHAEKDSGKPCPMLHPVARLTHIVSLIFFFWEEENRFNDSWIKEKRFHLFNEFLIIFFYQILLLFPWTRVHLPCLSTVKSIVIIYFYVR